MARRSDFGDVDALGKLSEDLRRIAKDSDSATADALNAGADFVIDRAPEIIASEINLETGYIRSNMDIGKRATESSLEARISARRRPTTHTRYGARYRVTRASSPIARLKGRSLGNVRRGMKADGLHGYRIKRSGRDQSWARGFIISSRGNVFTVTRTNKGIRTLYGISVASAFKAIRDDLQPQAVEVMEKSLIEGLS